MYKPIFISYSRKDKDYVIPFAKELDNRVGQNRIWIDWTGIESGEDFKDRIMNAIDRSQVILFMLSDNSLQSEYAKMEVEYAHNTNKKVIPVILDGKPLRGWFLFSFGRINYTDISDNDQVDQLVETLKKFQYAVNPKYLELARTYLNEHPKDVLYQVDYVRDDDDLNCSLLLNFTEKEIDCIRFFHEELGYSFMDLNYIDKWEGDENLGEERRNILFGALKEIDHEDGFLVDNIDYSQTVKAYKFRRAFFVHGFEGQPELSYFGAIINDEDYMKLLAIKMEDRKFCFNKLRYLMPDVFESISRDAEFIDEFLRNDFSVTYAVEMTEVEEDVFNIIGDESVSEEIYEEPWHDDRTRHTVLNIKEKVLSFFMEDIDCMLTGDRENIDNVNALDVQKAMNVDNYHGILDRFKLDFNGRDGVQIFKKWLDDNGINYSYNESHDVF